MSKVSSILRDNHDHQIFLFTGVGISGLQLFLSFIGNLDGLLLACVE